MTHLSELQMGYTGGRIDLNDGMTPELAAEFNGAMNGYGTSRAEVVGGAAVVAMAGGAVDGDYTRQAEPAEGNSSATDSGMAKRFNAELASLAGDDIYGAGARALAILSEDGAIPGSGTGVR